LAIGAAVFGVLVFAIAVRVTCSLNAKPVFDEKYITVPIIDLIERGWSVETAIDYTETKGPAMIWSYALLGEVVGSSIERLRLISIGFFVAGLIPLLLIAKRIALDDRSMYGIALLYVLLPMNAVLAQMVMSEASFIFGSLVLLWIFLIGFGTTIREQHHVFGPIAAGVMLTILLHHRIHAVAFAGAIALLSLERDGRRCWPWWIACAVAGVLRLPLVMRWDGFVAPAYQFSHTTGFSLANLTYLAAALAPFTGVFLIAWLSTPRLRRAGWGLLLAGASLGLLLGILATPSREAFIMWGDRELPRFQGFTFTLLDTVTGRLGDSAFVYGVLITIAAVIGLSSLAALVGIAHFDRADEPRGQTGRLLAFTLLTGWTVYALTDGQVFDRYILPWAALAPVLWWTSLPRWLRMANIVALLAYVIVYANIWLY